MLAHAMTPNRRERRPASAKQQLVAPEMQLRSPEAITTNPTHAATVEPPEEWQLALRVRDDVAATRSIDTMDTLVLEREDDEGRLHTSVGATLGWDHPDIKDLIRHVRHQLRQGEQGPARAATLFTYLPLVGSDLVVRIEHGGHTRVAFHDRYGELHPIGPSDERLREVAPCSRTRVARQIATGILESRGRDPEQMVEEALQRWPDYPPALKLKGTILKDMSETKAAGEAFRRAVKVSPEDAEAHFLLGDFLDEVGKDKQALESYDRAIALDPGFVHAHGQRGIVLRRLGRVEEAVKSYERALAIDANDGATRFNLAVLAYNDDDPATAFGHLEYIRPTHFPDGSQPRHHMAHISREAAALAMQEEAWLDGARRLSLATQFEPDTHEDWFNWGVCLARVGLIPEAVVKMREALRLHPEDESARQALEQLEAAEDEGQISGNVAVNTLHTIDYVDSRGNPAVMLNFIVKIESGQFLTETEVNRLSTRNDKDLTKLLIAKGHNARVASAGSKVARPIRFMLQQPPDDDFVRLASATSWITANGKVIESAPVEVIHGPDEGPETRLAESDEPFRLDRFLPEDEIGADLQRFYPPAYAEYEL